MSQPVDIAKWPDFNSAQVLSEGVNGSKVAEAQINIDETTIVIFPLVTIVVFYSEL